MGEWKPISEAPTRKWEGDSNLMLGQPEVIVGWRNSRLVAMAYWYPRYEEQGGGGHWEVIGGGYFMPPTHFMPLPEPPHDPV